MPYVSDRQMTESVLPAHLMLSVVLNGADDIENDADAQRCIALLRDAANEPVAHLVGSKAKEKIWRRSERAYRDVSKAWTGEGVAVGKFGLVVFYWLRALVDAGHLIMEDDSPFQQAMEILLPCLEPYANVEGIDRSAQKQAPKFHSKLQELGYYGGVQL